MTAFTGKTYWLIGASEGLGRDLARQLAAEGARLVLSARSEDRLKSLADDLPDARALPLDVTDLASVRAAVAEAGNVDGVIYGAGAYEPMAARDWDTETALKVADVNFTGAMRVLGEVVPGMVRAGRGDITLIGSLAGYHGLPASIGYSASKAGLVSLAETLRHDLRDTGVTVRLVNPGFIKTRLTDKNEFRMPQLMTPEDAAAKVLKAMKSRRFRTDFPIPFAWVIRLIDMLPDIVVYRGR
ncbi:short-chain dehydrogenase [Oceanicola sp. 22II-s10i]|uniref:SDR family NAD(P)-dependent oxidoreductase n=1 Tax=Oceanicola sp. 22II-s10i TaxID=1317116 RepID=UPI000B51EE51|nr:SDR family NAD(P)-dependent oxidoreductase [Oceanicola sp. 22II-s10i]OWU83383.1 short-chain dehydrogenase [Oceanicola sp. 22II-s10i]